MPAGPTPSGFLVEHKEVHTQTCKIGLEPAWLLGLSRLTRSAFLRGVSYIGAQNRPQSRTSTGLVLSYTGDFALFAAGAVMVPALVQTVQLAARPRMTTMITMTTNLKKGERRNLRNLRGQVWQTDTSSTVAANLGGLEFRSWAFAGHEPRTLSNNAAAHVEAAICSLRPFLQSSRGTRFPREP